MAWPGGGGVNRDIERWRATQRRGALAYQERRRSQPRTPIRAVSTKRARENRERAQLRPLVVGGPCAARLHGCTGIATDLHEVLSRARGGSITDLSNIRGLCRPCHTYITEHPAWALAEGWLLSQYGGRDGVD
jgi:hypothetical protein